MSDEAQKKPEKKREAKGNAIGAAIINKFNEFRSEFRKIVWPSREILLKHTITVIVVSLLFGAYITLADGLFGVAFTSFVRLIG